ncbi:MAG TPA: ATP-binding protein [archaeon]|nr:ATP-binding protein [archaeon]
MGELRDSILKQQLQREIDLARQCEAEGKQKEASTHYSKAASLYNLLGYKETANQYQSLGETIKKPITEDDKAVESAIDSLIVTQKPDTKWEDIGNLQEAKTTLKEAIILPFIKKKPDFVRSTKTILLYGPPGTGKTLLAKASSHTLDASFFEAQASTLLSKYYGESNKILSALFLKAREVQPSLVFMDEIDSIVLSREGDIHEATRRVVGQLLSELEGFSTKKEDKVIFIGATNRPWDLDDALLSRFERKIYVPLPDSGARKTIFQIHTKGVNLDGITHDDLAGLTNNFSGRDISNVCREAVASMIREQNSGLEDLTSKQIDSYTLKHRPLTKNDFDISLKKIKPVSDEADLRRFDKWKEEFGG